MLKILDFRHGLKLPTINPEPCIFQTPPNRTSQETPKPLHIPTLALGGLTDEADFRFVQPAVGTFPSYVPESQSRRAAAGGQRARPSRLSRSRPSKCRPWLRRACPSSSRGVSSRRL